MVTIVIIGLIVWGLVRAGQVYDHWGENNYPTDPEHPNYDRRDLL